VQQAAAIKLDGTPSSLAASRTLQQNTNDNLYFIDVKNINLQIKKTLKNMIFSLL